MKKKAGSYPDTDRKGYIGLHHQGSDRITWFGGFFLAIITIAPIILGNITKIPGIWFGGTAVLILVGVALDTVKAIESQMLMRHYKGFLE